VTNGAVLSIEGVHKYYTMGETPFKFVDGYHICSFLKKWL